MTPEDAAAMLQFIARLASIVIQSREQPPDTPTPQPPPAPPSDPADHGGYS
jgi:hypothetical protein